LGIYGAASTEVRQAYRQFIGGVVELIDGEVQSEEFREVALNVYRIFGEEESADGNFTQKK
jgi:activating signal cointegrator complex subunit 3